MPRLIGVRERFDQIVVHTFNAEPGQIETFETPRTDSSYVLAGMALRVLDTTPDEDARLLDHFTVRLSPMKKNRNFGPWPGTVLSTFRTIMEPVIITEEVEVASKRQHETQAHPYRAAGKRASGKELHRMAWATMPGYVFLRPFVLRVYEPWQIRIDVSSQLPTSWTARFIAFGLMTREVTPWVESRP